MDKKPSTHDTIEKLYFDRHGDAANISPPILHILGSPRTGSTLIYQILVNQLNTLYFSNLINTFPAHPIIGAALQLGLALHRPMPLESNYGKTQLPLEPSEASPVFGSWFGGQHPSQTHSKTFLPGRSAHYCQTIRTMHALCGLPVLTKNAWNCFRIEALVKALPSTSFVWIRRDIVASALSDLESRYKHGGPDTWSSATTSNYQKLQKRPYWVQVVEQQFEYNKAIEEDLKQFASDRYVEIWYEDICDNTDATLHEAMEKIRQLTGAEVRESQQPALTRSSGYVEMKKDLQLITQYADTQNDRLAPYRR